MQFTLTRAISIPAGQAHINFQDGSISTGRDLFSLHCEFEVGTVSETAQTIHADTFSVTQSSQRLVLDEQSGMPTFATAAFGCDTRYFERHFWLSSKQQPDVRKLICRQGFHFCDGQPLTLDAIQQTLGATLLIRNAHDKLL